ncbi:unnamed protein product [Symbiodinium microadriaticum]|nr:unnamed protein product [Symbiodinium microadriaticum]
MAPMCRARPLRRWRQPAARSESSCSLRPVLLLGFMYLCIVLGAPSSFAMPFKAGQETEAFKALMSAARGLELTFEGMALNGSAVSEFEYGEADFEEGLGHISSAWATAIEGRELRELCIRVEHDWVKAACGSVILTFLIDFQRDSPIEMEFEFFGGSSDDKSFPGECNLWELAEEQLSLGPAGWSQAASLLPFEEPLKQEDEEEEEKDEAFPPYPDIYPAVLARFFAEHLGVTRLTGMRYAGRCEEILGGSVCKRGDFRFTTA